MPPRPSSAAPSAGPSSSPTPAFLAEYESVEIIGQGSFGKIRKVRRKKDGVIFARKELDFEKMGDKDRKQIVAEVNILRELSHANIVAYHERHVDRDGGMLYILMEFCGGGDLQSVIKNCRRTGTLLPEDIIWAYTAQLASALEHCHHRTAPPGTVVDPTSNPPPPARRGSGGAADGKQQILHRDLKPENVFLDANGNIKLGDFGLSKATQVGEMAKTYVGTPYYMSPELMRDMPYDTKSDIWSLGCLVYELAALNPPFFDAKTHSQLQEKILHGRIPKLPRGFSPALDELIRKMLSPNPRDRPSAPQILDHPLVKQATRASELSRHASAIAAQQRALKEREKRVLEREAAFESWARAEVDRRVQEEVERRMRGVERAVEEEVQRRVGEALVREREALGKEREREREEERNPLADRRGSSNIITTAAATAVPTPAPAPFVLSRIILDDTPTKPLSSEQFSTPSPLDGRCVGTKSLGNLRATAVAHKLVALASENVPPVPAIPTSSSAPPQPAQDNSIPRWQNLPPPPPTPCYANAPAEELPSPFLRKPAPPRTNSAPAITAGAARGGLVGQAAAQRAAMAARVQSVPTTVGAGGAGRTSLVNAARAERGARAALGR